MIEINLSPSKKAAGLTNFAGIDLSLINVKMMVIAILIWYVPEPILVDMWDDEIASHNKKSNTLNSELRKLQGQIRGLQNVQKQVDALAEQEQKLARKLQTVKKIINKRQNPFIILKYITDNIPPNVWLTKLELNDTELKMMGHGKSWKDIGDFLEALKSSIFFSKQVNYSRPQNMKNEFKGQRVEAFEITTQIVRFK